MDNFASEISILQLVIVFFLLYLETTLFAHKCKQWMDSVYKIPLNKDHCQKQPSRPIVANRSYPYGIWRESTMLVSVVVKERIDQCQSASLLKMRLGAQGLTLGALFTSRRGTLLKRIEAQGLGFEALMGLGVPHKYLSPLLFFL